MDCADGDEHPALTDALPTEMVCRIVSLFRAHPGDWMALLLTSRTMAAACRATLDPASDRVRSGATGAGPTLAARLVTRHAADVPAVLDAYRCANASALLVEACRANDLALVRILLAGRARWRVDVTYRYNRPLLECVRLNSALGVQLLLATGDTDPVDHPGAAHLGRCALHDDPVCRRPDHPGLCDACARGQPGGPWSDSDDDEDQDGYDADAHGGTHLDPYYDDDPLADTDEDDEGEDDDREDHHDPSPVDQQAIAGGSSRAPPADPVPTSATVATATLTVHAHESGGTDDGDFEVDYDALFEGENDADNDGGGEDDVDDVDDDSDYEPHARVYASLVEDGDGDDERARNRARGADHNDGDNDRESGDDESRGPSLWTGDDEDDDDEDDDNRDGEPRHEAVAWEGAPDPMPPAQIIPSGSGNNTGHALAVRRANLARCVCRRGMTFAIVWIDDQGREIGGRAQGPASEPLWFLVCEDPTALVADGPLSFLTAHAHPPNRPPAPMWRGDDDDRETIGGDGSSAPAATDPVGHAEAGGDTGQDQGGYSTADNVVDRVYDNAHATVVPGQRLQPHAAAAADAAVDSNADDTAPSHREEADGHERGPSDANSTNTAGSVVAIEHHGFGRTQDGHDGMMRAPCTCASRGRPFYTQAMERWCPLFWAALMSVGVLGQLLGHVGVESAIGRCGAGAMQRWACRPSDVLAMAVAQMVVFSSASRMASLSDIHAAALDLILGAGAIDLAAHGDFLVAFAADRGCGEIIEMLVEHGAGVIDVTAHNDLALRRALWRYVRLYRPAFGAGARLEPEERSSRMCLYAAALVALASAAGLDTGGMDPADALMEPLDPGFVRALARRVYPGMTANEIGRLRLAPLRPHYPPPFTPPL
ncbi:hypothetical protein psal_cds_201 [Pandoravirus salinus]|uniref:Ankyrin repeat domain containing protein n=1 Tax=Pandoravirus salinus TaxID=1349410 RepID=S4VTC7_9VIRU|nr:hypothetical protein psal_cds_201 [Pandoravirus salinus]AGO83719.1 hypothetical protein psal_cds_201 [Pandoravirus salinus]